MNEETLLKQLDSILSEGACSVTERERSSFDCLLADAENRVVLFGAGNLGRRALNLLRSVGVEPLGFADNNEARWGTISDGVTIYSPKEAADRFGKCALFVVTIWSLGHNFRDTRDKLLELGCSRVAPVAPLRWKFSDQLLPFYNQDLPHKIYEQSEEVRAAAFLWSDDQSRCEYLNQIKFRTHGDHAAVGLAAREESYFPDDLFALSPDEVFIDCGAYDGDTARMLIERQRGKFRHIFEIEPDVKNLSRLQKWIRSLDAETSARISLLDMAVGSTRKQVRFNSSGDEGAAIAESGETVVECAPLDELLSGCAPTYIKMDIEGAEIDALQGAKELIEREEPVLAICSYHIQNDMWRIPLLIHSLSSRYQLFFRAHDVEGWQLVCYAVPPKRLAT